MENQQHGGYGENAYNSIPVFALCSEEEPGGWSAGGGGGRC